jgi:hypothetical protein
LKPKARRTILLPQFFILLIFLLLTLANEILDLPHYLFNDPPISANQRTGEVIIELSVFVFVIALECVLFNKLLERIRILEGLLPICGHCKKIKIDDKWEQLETYITKHSLAKFSHSICPDCMKTHYPGLAQCCEWKNAETLSVPP